MMQGDMGLGDGKDQTVMRNKMEECRARGKLAPEAAVGLWRGCTPTRGFWGLLRGFLAAPCLFWLLHGGCSLPHLPSEGADHGQTTQIALLDKVQEFLLPSSHSCTVTSFQNHYDRHQYRRHCLSIKVCFNTGVRLQLGLAKHSLRAQNPMAMLTMFNHREQTLKRADSTSLTPVASHNAMPAPNFTGVTPFLIYTIFIVTLGPLLFGFHLVGVTCT
jgi:hypothetical protein